MKRYRANGWYILLVLILKIKVFKFIVDLVKSISLPITVLELFSPPRLAPKSINKQTKAKITHLICFPYLNNDTLFS